MELSDIFLLSMLVSALGVVIFAVSAIINLFKRQDAKTEWKRSAIFIGLTFLFFVLFGISIG